MPFRLVRRCSRVKPNVNPACKQYDLAAIMRLELGSTRALACADRRPRRSESRGITSPNGGVLEAAGVVGAGADHRTRGRVRSPLNCMDTA
jgi:hypothetical protein